MPTTVQPQIHGAAVHGARPGHPVLYAMAATGERPLTYGVDGRPDGLAVAAESGPLTGSCAPARPDA
ncbi:MAG: hypothetical protein IT204_20925, partial [Fimbriimonadaceae bacterium]|nr:hypothetical protein [Fimbriimonadaceae bacterium]